MKVRKFAVPAVVAAALLALPGLATGQAAASTETAAGPGWHHVQNFAAGDESGCHARGRWYLQNGVNRYECRPAGVWQLWVLTDS